MKHVIKMTLLLLMLITVISGCGGAAPSGTLADSDSNQNFATIRGDQFLPIDFGVYHIVGEVLPMQVPVKGIVNINGEPVVIEQMEKRAYQIIGDKSVMHIQSLHVTYIPSDVKVDGVEEVAEAISTEELADTKLTLKVSSSALLAAQIGDIYTFVCVPQAESAAAVANNEPRSDTKLTWELDYCRIEKPVILDGYEAPKDN